MTKDWIANRALLVYPESFGFNYDTFETNKFQNPAALGHHNVRDRAIIEFENFVSELSQCDIDLLVYRTQDEQELVDAVFPNNWFITLPGKKLFTFPMRSELRRRERREDIIEDFRKNGYSINRELELFEKEDKFLEGTGSLVLDHRNEIAYAAISPRTHEEVLDVFCELAEYEPFSFRASGPTGEPIYHTNVMMSIGSEIAIIALDTVEDECKENLLNKLEAGRTVIRISNDQAYKSFLGNCLFIRSKSGDEKLIMSTNAYNSLWNEQRSAINLLGIDIVNSDLDIIEKVGGGSARCMLAEIYD